MVLDAFHVKAGETLLLACEAFARVAARVNLIATHLHEIDAGWLSANILEGLLVTDRWFGQLFPAESTFESCLEVSCLFTGSA